MYYAKLRGIAPKDIDKSIDWAIDKLSLTKYQVSIGNTSKSHVGGMDFVDFFGKNFDLFGDKIPTRRVIPKTPTPAPNRLLIFPFSF